jgi:hypothetical protein
VIFRGQTELDNAVMDVPSVYNQSLKGHVISYKFRSNRRGVTSSAVAVEHDVSEFGGYVPTARQPKTVTFQLEEGVRNIRGYVSREETDFQFVPVARVGVIPPTEGNVAPNANETSGSGSGNQSGQSTENPLL